MAKKDVIVAIKEREMLQQRNAELKNEYMRLTVQLAHVGIEIDKTNMQIGIAEGKIAALPKQAKR